MYVIPIKKMTTYSTSNGTRLKKSVIDRRIREAKKEKLEQQKDEHGFNFCVQCHEILKRNEAIECNNSMELTILDCSHIESVDSCQKNGYAEKAYDLNNIEILCRHHHKIRDRLY